MSLLQFLIAGFETTSTAISLCLYVCSRNPSEMVTLQQEIDKNFKDYEDMVKYIKSYYDLMGKQRVNWDIII